MTGDYGATRISLMQKAEPVCPEKLCVCKPSCSSWVPSVLPLPKATLLATAHHLSPSKKIAAVYWCARATSEAPMPVHNIIFSLGPPDQAQVASPGTVSEMMGIAQPREEFPLLGK